MEKTDNSAGAEISEHAYQVPGVEGGVTKNGDRIVGSKGQRMAAYTNINEQSSEFGFYGTQEGQDSGLTPTATPD